MVILLGTQQGEVNELVGSNEAGFRVFCRPPPSVVPRIFYPSRADEYHGPNPINWQLTQVMLEMLQEKRFPLDAEKPWETLSTGDKVFLAWPVPLCQLGSGELEAHLSRCISIHQDVPALSHQRLFDTHVPAVFPMDPT